MSLLLFKQWIYKKRNKPYKILAEEYSMKMDTFLKQERKLEQDRLANMSKTVLIEDINLSGFKLSLDDFPDAKVGDIIEIRHLKSDEILGIGSSVRKQDRILIIKLNKQIKLDKEKFKERHFKINFSDKFLIQRSKSFIRPMNKIRDIRLSLPIHKCLMGFYNDQLNEKFKQVRVLDIFGLPKPVNDNQLLAIRKSLKNRISLVEGVAGSGKTTVAANIACSNARLKKRRVLICSPVSLTVDKLADLIQDADNVKVVHLIKDCGITHSSWPCSMNKLVNDEIYKIAFKSYKDLNKYSYELNLNAHRHARKQIRVCSYWLRNKLERKLLKEADVVCCSLDQVGTDKLDGIKFDMLIIDDVHVALGVDCIRAIATKGIKQVTLLSDMRRSIRLSRSFAPNFNSNTSNINSMNRVSRKVSLTLYHESNRSSWKSANNKTKISRDFGDLFEHWLSMGIAAVALTEQLRMHRTLAQFPNYHFYLSRSTNNNSMDQMLNDRVLKEFLNKDNNFDWLPKKDCFTSMIGACNESSSTKQIDIVNRCSNIIEELVKKTKLDISEFGVITNSESLMNEFLSNSFVHANKVGTVTDFIGKESDIIILACIKNDNQDVVKSSSISSKRTVNDDYLVDNDSLNVALTRARLGLIIITDLTVNFEMRGDKNDQSYSRSWLELVQYYRANGLII